jgi:hypothetical protein
LLFSVITTKEGWRSGEDESLQSEDIQRDDGGDGLMGTTSSTEFLQIMGKSDTHAVFERAIPAGRLKRDIIYLCGRDGEPLAMSTPPGFQSSHFELPRAIFDDFYEARLIEQEGPEDSSGRIFYRLTPDGRARARSADCVTTPGKPS